MAYLTARATAVCLSWAVLTMIASAATGQDRAGTIAKSSVGKAGERLSETKLLPVRPTARINNRVQSRVRNRIDRSYNPSGDTTTAFREASDQVRATRK